MTDSTGGIHRGRVAGVALLAVAAVALVIGVITLFGSDGDGQAQQPGQTTTAAPTGGGDPSPSQPGSTTPSTGSSAAPTTTSSAAPPATSAPGTPGTPGTSAAPPGGGQPGGGQTGPKTEPVRVYNNSTIKGLAEDAEGDFRGQGWNVIEVGNYSQGLIATTTVYFRPGTGEEAAAREIGAAFGMRVEPRFDGIQGSSPGVIVIVTKDYKHQGSGNK